MAPSTLPSQHRQHLSQAFVVNWRVIGRALRETNRDSRNAVFWALSKRLRFGCLKRAKSPPVLLVPYTLALNSPRKQCNMPPKPFPLAINEATHRRAAMSHGDDGRGPSW
ncbi:hypothetical protein PIB30_005912 [Stylosanthes scabra]|uniref:Uncharacterized protein n=1 Tax=Stylosanthes scabra TaxID=79078 RepID=A0ABU6R3Z1_9FABA|nr:hypothetical protein [Stylosanthes scabra]